MPKRISIILTVLIVIVSFLYVANAQKGEKGWLKTVTLPSADVILDMSGEWDVMYEPSGYLSRMGTYGDTLTITQEGAKFTAVKQFGSRFVPKGAESIKGELDKSGFKEVYLCTQASPKDTVWEPCKWEISENGNKVVLDYESGKATLTRK
jgi:hypothetical protein